MGSDMSKRDLERQVEKLKADLEAADNNLIKLTESTVQYLKELKNATLDIAITGASGTGKSSLVNALRGIKDDEEGAAETGVTQTTMETTAYSHPKFSNVTIWDLPGIGTPEFQANIYLEMVNFKRYDFFIIVAVERFTQHEVFLAHEIHKTNKKFYYVRNKINQDIANEERKRDFNKEKTLEKIRKYCCDSLAKAGESDPRVFLISVFDLGVYDFPLLVDALENDLDEFKRYTLITMLSNSLKASRKKKKAAMEKLIFSVVLVSCLTGNENFPGLNVSCNASVLEETMRHFSNAFGLDEDSLSRLANKVGKSVSVLRSAIRKTVIADQIDAVFIYRKLLDVKPKDEGIKRLGSMILDQIPLLGTIIWKSNSFLILYHMLQTFLDDVQEDAENVWETAFEISEPQTQ